MTTQTLPQTTPTAPFTKPKPELLLPAGDPEKLRYAIAYGADAVYLGLGVSSLRTVHSKDPFTIQNLPHWIDYCHQHNVKAYVTLNIFANNRDLDRLAPHLEQLETMKPDAFIISDPGIFRLAQKHAPSIPIHVSTQANVLNTSACAFWQDLGAERVILAREVPLREMAEIHETLPNLEVECFVHGSLCVAYSGRCVISDYMTDNTKNSNKGMCGNSCRWEFEVKEKSRPDASWTLEEDERGSYLFNSKDLCLVRHLKDLMLAGVMSFKVEGRTKGVHYVSTVGRVYREAIDAVYNDLVNGTQTITPQQEAEWEDELLDTANRGFTNGFLFGKPGSSGYYYQSSQSMANAQFVAHANGPKTETTIEITGRNPLKTDQPLVAMSPKGIVVIEQYQIMDKNSLPVAQLNPNQIGQLVVNAEHPIHQWQTDDLQWCLFRQAEPIA